MLSSGANGDTITCLQCAPNDMIVTVGARTFPLLTGQTLTVTLAGVVATIATTVAILQGFSGAGLATGASATAPVAGAGAAAGAASGAAAAAAGAVVVGGAAAAASSNNKSSSQATAQPVPVATATGTGTIQSHRR